MGGNGGAILRRKSDEDDRRSPTRPVWIDDEELFREWDGVALYVAPDEARLRASAPVIPIVGWWTFLGLAISGIAVLCFVGYRRSVAAGKVGFRGISRRPWLLSSAGWVLIAIGGYCVARAASSPIGQSTITVDSLSQTIDVSDFALREADGLVRGEFVLTNHAEQPALVARVTPNCTCAKVTVSRRRIPPGGSARIGVDVDLGDQSSREARLLVEMEDAVPQSLTLRLTATRIQGPRD